MKGSNRVERGDGESTGDRLTDIESELTDALAESEDDEQRYHIRKAAQRIVLAQESDR
jgi:hypothetical protein